MQMDSSKPGGHRFRSLGAGWLPSLFFCLSLGGLLVTPALAQVTSGSLTGVVSDPSGAVVPEAKVVLTDTNKGYDYPAKTDAVGRYLITNLPPSTYTLSVEAPGFKSFKQQDVVVDVGTRVSVDVHMALGATAVAVEVTGAVPVLSTQDAVTGQEVDRTLINNLPLVDRNVMDLAFLSPGVIQQPGREYHVGGGIDFVSNGGRNDTSEVLLDGIAQTSYEPNTGINTLLYQPSVDAVQEFKIMQNNYTAEEGFSGNTYVNMVMRSGTNSIHGDVYEFLRNKVLDANNFFSNASGGTLPALHRNQFGGSVGGPIKKDKTFFFFDFDGTREAAGTTHNAGVPSMAERQGDFSELCTNVKQGNSSFDANGICKNSNYQLWDPYSGKYVAGTGRELQVPIPHNNLAAFKSSGNPNLNGTGFQIAAQPGNLIDPVAFKMMQYYPAPNVGVGTAAYNPYNNWSGSGANTDTGNQYDIRIDHRFTDKDAFNARYSQNTGTYHNWDCYGNALDTCTQGPGVGSSHSIALNLNHTFSPTTLLNVSVGFTRGLSDTMGNQKAFPNFNPITTLGLPSYMATDNGPIAAPTIYMYGGYSDPNGAESIGSQAWSIYKNGNQVYHFLSTLTHMRGSHELKFGGEWRVQQMNWFQDGTPGGVYVYDQYGTAQYPYWGGGDALASFLTGVPNPNQWGEYEISPHFSTQNHRFGGFMQDNWRAKSKLTVNIGLRYDLEIPRTERYNRMSWIDPTVQLSSVHPAAIASSSWVYKNAAGQTVSLPFAIPDVTHPTGGLVFANKSQRNIVDTAYKDFGPRLGLSYQLREKLVLRAGYGLFYNPTQWGTTGAGPVGNEGFEAVTGWVTTMNSDGSTPWSRISNPEPTGLLMPTGPSLGPLTNLGAGINEPFRDSNIPPYSQTWSGGVQYELPNNWLIDANYLGTKGTHLYYHGAGTMQYLGSWVEQEATNPDLRTALGTMVPNPYYGVINTPGCGICGPTIAAGNLLRPYPQFNGFAQPNPPWANSIYHAFQLKIEKRLSQGLAMLASYTFSKSIDDASVSTSTEWIGGFGTLRDPNNLKEERSLSEWDIPQVLQLSYVYQLPFGKGKKWGGAWNSVVNGFVGGWQTSGIWRFDSGQPVSLSVTGATAPWGYSASFPDQNGKLLVNSKSKWFCSDPGCGYFLNANQVLSVPAPYTIGNASRMEPNTRLPGTANATLSVFKDVSLNKVREGSRLQIRAEAFNALNHPQFGGINTQFNGGNFGAVQSQVNSPREIQMGLQIYF
jgi:hypothetical protein